MTAQNWGPENVVNLNEIKIQTIIVVFWLSKTYSLFIQNQTQRGWLTFFVLTKSWRIETWFSVNWNTMFRICTPLNFLAWWSLHKTKPGSWSLCKQDAFASKCRVRQCTSTFRWYAHSAMYLVVVIFSPSLLEGCTEIYATDINAYCV